MRSITHILAVIAIALTGIMSSGSSTATTGTTDTQSAESQPEARKAVLITGASTGIGRRTAEVLAENGFYVYAGARKQRDLDALNAIDNISAVKLDVTSQEEVDAAVKFIESEGRGLFGLINNAGVAVVAPLIEVRDEDLQFQMDVNVSGVVRVTRAFAPMIIESKGRISTTGSISGFISWAFGGPYSMSKHAMEAYNDALTQELGMFGVAVSIVEPGNYKSEITTSMQQRMIDRGYTGKGSMYENQMSQMVAAPMDRSQYKEPDDVANAFLHFVTSDAPKLRYMVVPNQNEADMTLISAFNRVAQINQAHPFSHSRDELVAMLDAALERNQPTD